MELLYLLAALTEGPLRFLLALLGPLLLALAAFAGAWRRASRHPGTAARWLPSALLAGVLALAFAMLVGVVQPARSIQETLTRSALGHVDKAAAHAAIERNYTLRGIALHGLLQYGPLAFCTAVALGLWVGDRRRRMRVPGK